MAMTAPKFAGNTQDSPELAQNKWVVLGACFTINFISSAFFRNAALFYPSIMGTFLVTRERAALPLFVYGGCFHLGALLGGTVIQVLTVWAAAVAGGILLSTTFIASSFVNGTAFLTAVLGVIGGTGQGIIFNCSVVGLADYFSSRRGLALGVVMTGAPAASFIFPAIFNYTLEEHGLRGTLLLTGAYMLNIPVFGLLLRTGLRSSTEEACRQSETNQSTTKSKLWPSSRAHYTDKDGSPPTICQSVESLSRSNSDDHIRRGSILKSSKSFRIPDLGGTETSKILKDGLSSNTTFGITSSRPRSSDPQLETWPCKTNTLSQKSLAQLHDIMASSLPALIPLRKSTEVDPVKLKDFQRRSSIKTGSRLSRWTTLCKSAALVARTRQFYMIAYSFWAYCLFLDTYLTVIVDYCVDSGVDQGDALHVLHFFSVTDALCRLVIPILSDCNVLSTPVLLASSYLVASVLAASLALLTEKIGFWIVALALGLPCGYINVGLSESLYTAAGEENLPMALGFMSAAAAVGSFTTPTLIGLFRDMGGFYDDLFFIMAGAMMVSFALFAGHSVIKTIGQKKLTISQ